MKKAKVIKSHTSEFPVPFKAHQGEIVKGYQKSTEWEGWLYCENDAKISGWVPQSYLEKQTGILDGNQYKFLRNYDATELDIESGSMVVIKEIDSEWAWVSRDDGRLGWIPLANLHVFESE